MDVAENYMSVMDRKEVKIIFAKSKTKNLVRNHDKNRKIRIFRQLMRTHKSLEKGVLLGISASARKKGSLVCKTENFALTSEPHNQEEETDDFNQVKGNGKRLLPSTYERITRSLDMMGIIYRKNT